MVEKQAQLNIQEDSPGLLGQEDEVYMDHNFAVDPDMYILDEDDEDIEVSSDENTAHDEDEKGVLLHVEDPDDEEEVIIFSLPFVPGADDDTEIEADDDLDVEEEQEVEVEEADPWNWEKTHGLSGFLGWLVHMMGAVPKHSGRSISGNQRASSYLSALKKEITKAMRKDVNGVIDEARAEDARSQIIDGIERLNEREEKLNNNLYNRGRKKKSDDESGELVKEAQKVAGVNGIVVTVPLTISRIARVCINGMVSGGHDIEDLFNKQAELNKLNDREKEDVIQLIIDMGYPVRRDRMILHNQGYDPKRSDNGDFSAHYPG